MILLNWLFQDEVLFQAISRNLSKMIVRNEDKFLALGWCLLVRGLVECADNGDQSFWNGELLLFNLGHLSLGKRKDFPHSELTWFTLCPFITFSFGRNMGETFDFRGDCFILCASLGDDCTQWKVSNFFVSGYIYIYHLLFCWSHYFVGSLV